MRLRFRFRAIPFIATLLLVLVGSLLGNWQSRRAEEKTLLQARLDAQMAAPPLRLDGGPALRGPVDTAALEFRRVIVSGEFVPTFPVFLDNRPQGGRTGFVLLMPFKIAGADRYVLVARGWLPRNTAEHDKLPPFATPPGRLTIEGRVVLHPARVMQLGTPAPLKPNAIVQNATVDEVARASGLPMLPLMIEQTGPAMGGEQLARQWPAPGVDVDRHKGYAVQWYALAAMAFLFFVIIGFRSGTRQAG